MFVSGRIRIEEPSIPTHTYIQEGSKHMKIHSALVAGLLLVSLRVRHEQCFIMFPNLMCCFMELENITDTNLSTSNMVLEYVLWEPICPHEAYIATCSNMLHISDPESTSYRWIPGTKGP